MHFNSLPRPLCHICLILYNLRAHETPSLHCWSGIFISIVIFHSSLLEDHPGRMRKVCLLDCIQTTVLSGSRFCFSLSYHWSAHGIAHSEVIYAANRKVFSLGAVHTPDVSVNRNWCKAKEHVVAMVRQPLIT